MCLTLFPFFCSLQLHAQEQDSVAVRRTFRQNLMEDVTAPRPHDPRRALRLSAVLPGAGQVYNRQAWKVPVIYAAFAGVGYYTYFNYTHMRDYKDEYLYRVNHNDAVNNDEFANIPTSNVYSLYEAYNKSFQLSIIIVAAVYGLNLIDAYVFAHLFDFQINDDLTLNVCPMLMPSLSSSLSGQFPTSFSFSPAAGITLRF